MQEASRQPHIDQYRSKLYNLYTFNDSVANLAASGCVRFCFFNICNAYN